MPKDYTLASSLTDMAFNKATNLQTSKQDKLLRMNPSASVTDAYSFTSTEDNTPKLLQIQKENTKRIMALDSRSPDYDKQVDAITSEGRMDRLLSNNSNTAEPSIAELRKWNNDTNRGGNGSTSFLDQAPRAVGAGVLNLGSRLLELGVTGNEKIAEAIGATEYAEQARKAEEQLQDYRSTGAFEKAVGYDTTKVQKYGEKFKDKVKQGEYLGAIGAVFSDPEAASLAFLNSTPEMMYMMTGLGLGTTVAANVNDNLYKLNESAKVQGREVTGQERATSMALSTVGTLLDRLGDKAMMGNKLVPDKLKDGIVTTLDTMTPAVRSAVLQRLGKDLTKVGVNVGEYAGRTGVEGATEGLQTLMENKASDVSKMNIGVTQGEIDEALVATGIGLGAGGVGTTITSPQTLVEPMKVVGKGVMDTANAGLNKLSEVSTGRTVEDVKAKKQAEVNLRTDVTTAFDARRVPITEGMSEDEVAKADMVNEQIDRAMSSLQETNLRDEGFKEKLDASINSIDTMKSEMGITPTETKVEDTTAEEVVEPVTDPVQKVVDEYKATGAEDSDMVAARLHSAGLDQISTLNDRKAKVGVELIEGVDVKETSKKKGKLFDPLNTTDEQIGNVIREGFAPEGKVANVISRIAKKLGYGKGQHRQVQQVAKRIEEGLQNETVKAAAQKILPKGTEATVENVMRAIAIGVANVRSADIAQFDINAKYGSEREAGTGANRLGLDVQIGKAYVNAFGARFTGEAENTARAYKEKGDAILDLMKELDMVDTDSKWVPVHNMVNKDGSRVTETDLNNMAGVQVKKIDGVLMATLPNVVLKGSEKNNKRIRKDEMADALSTLSKMFTPNNYEMVSTEGQDTVIMAKGGVGVKISDMQVQIIKDLSKLKFNVKPEAFAIFDELDRLLDDKYEGDMDKLMNDDLVQFLLGVENSNAALIKMNESGRSVARKDNLAKVLENWKEIKSMMAEEGGFNFSYESARNERIHVMQTIFDFQGGKYMERQVLTGGEYTTKSNDARQVLVDEVTDELGITEEEISNPTGTLLKVFKSMDKQNGTLQLATLQKAVKELGIDKPFKAMSLLRAAYDIYNSKGGAVTTSYVPESDATASGVMNTLLNLSGFTAVKETLESMGILPSPDGKVKAFDPYSALSDSAWSNIDTEKNFELEQTIKDRDQLLDVFVSAEEGTEQYTKGVKKFLRNLAKSPMMTWFYGQKDKNTMQSMGNSIAVDLAKEAIKGNKKALDLINEKLGSNYTLPLDVKLTPKDGKYVGNSIKDITKADVNKLSGMYADTIGKLYVEKLGDMFHDVKKYREMMNKLYGVLEGSGQWEGTIGSAMAAINGGTEKMSIQKLKGMTLEDVNQELLMVNKMMNNQTSFSVNLQHATDAAILLMTVKKVMESKKDTSGMMTVHDAIYADANTAMEIMKAYNEYAIEAAIKYDYVQAGIKETEEVITKITDVNDKKDAQKKLDEVKAWYEGVHEKKVEFLKDLQLNILGNVEVGARVNPDTYSSKSGKKDTKPSVQTEAKKATAPIRDAMAALKKGIKAESMMEAVEALKSMKISKESKELLDKIESAVMRGVSIEFGDEYSSKPRTVYVPKKGMNNPVQEMLGRNELMTVDTLIEVLAHETDHAVQLSWIMKNRDTAEVKYLGRVVEKLIGEKSNPKVSQYVQSRLQHIENAITSKGLDEMVAKNPQRSREDILKAYQVSELSAVMMNEKEFQKEITKLLAPNVVEKTFNAIKDMIKNAYKTFSEYMNGKDIGTVELDLEGTIRAMESLNDHALAAMTMDTVSGKDFVPANMVKEKDLNPKVSLNPVTAFNDGVEKANRVTADWMVIWGDAMGEIIGPRLSKTHRKLKHSLPVYNEVVSLMKNGFYDSDWGQRLQQFLKVSNDTKEKAMKKALTLFSSYKQESATERGRMMEMKRQIEEKYNKKDRKVVHRVFADTGIANLIMMPEVKDMLLNGERTVEELVKMVGDKLDSAVKNKLDDVANHMVNGESESNAVNVRYANTNKKEAYVYVTLKALSMVQGGEKILTGMDSELRDWMMSMALANKELNDMINENGQDYQGEKYSKDAKNHMMYDGSYSMDIYDKKYETKMVSVRDMRRTENMKEAGWTVLIAPTDKAYGYLVRENMNAGRVTGVGLEMNRYVNGLMLSREESELIHEKIKDSEPDVRNKYLADNHLVQDGNRFRVLLSKEVKREKLGLEENAAHSLFMTYIHNKELIQAESIRKLMLDQATRKVNTVNGMKELERVLRENDRKGIRGKFGERVEVEPFVSIDYYADGLKDLTYDQIQEQYPMIAKYYRIPEGLTSFNEFNKKISLVKRGVSEILLGHENFSLFGKTEYRELAKYEQLFKKMIIAIKMKMVVTDPVKLALDSVSNISILSMMDIGAVEIYEGMKEGLGAYKEYSVARTKMVHLAMDARLLTAKAKMSKTPENEKAAKYAVVKLENHKKAMEDMKFHDAFNNGFVQSYSTDLVVKEFDAVSGLQKDVDDFIDKYTHDKKGDPNKLFDAIKWWQGVGIGMDDVFRKAGALAAKKNTSLGEELVELADRLKNKKNDKESVARYLSDVIGSPASEAVNYGSAYMVLSDALSKYVLAQHLMGRENPASGKPGNRKKYTKEEAYSYANDTFIDYRTNLPHEIKALSDYGIMMFPSFWMKIQRTVVNLLRYHPVSTAGTFAIEQALTEGNTHIVNQALPLKFGDDTYTTVLNNPAATIADNPWSVVFALGGI